MKKNSHISIVCMYSPSFLTYLRKIQNNITTDKPDIHVLFYDQSVKWGVTWEEARVSSSVLEMAVVRTVHIYVITCNF